MIGKTQILAPVLAFTADHRDKSWASAIAGREFKSHPLRLKPSHGAVAQLEERSDLRNERLA